MSSKFKTGFEKVAVAALLARGAMSLGRGLARIGSGNLRKPLTLGDKVSAGLGALGAASDASDYSSKFKSQYR